MKRLMFGVALGAALAYLFDPQFGARRRDALRARFDGTPAGSRVPDDASTIDVVMFDERIPAVAP